MAFAQISNAGKLSTDTNTAVTASIDTTGAALLVAFVAHDKGSAVAPTDSKSNTWTAGTAYETAGSMRVQMYYVIAPTVGSGHTFTLASTGNLPGIGVVAYSVGNAPAVYDQVNGAPSNSALTLATGSITPGAANAVLLTAMTHVTISTAFDCDSPFAAEDISLPTTANAYGIGVSDEIQTTATARNPTWTDTNDVGANLMAVTIVSFIETAPIGGGRANFLTLLGVS